MSRYLYYLVSHFLANGKSAALCHLLEAESGGSIDSRLAKLLNKVQYQRDLPRPRLSGVDS
jgi:hypothetical protein